MIQYNAVAIFKMVMARTLEQKSFERDRLMDYIITADNIADGTIAFYDESSAYPGAKRIADKVRADIGLVFGNTPVGCANITDISTMPVIYGTIGRSETIDRLAKKGYIDISRIQGKRECYFFGISEIRDSSDPLDKKTALVIAGSDKRGTIYGLFHLSELIGVSPFVDWLDLKPQVKERVVISIEDMMISKEPSVRFRGFFINDEWPAFGTWCNHHYDGFTAECYEHVFELLLRLKGNYLWPAMWSSIFPDDGPQLASAELADELGVVMGMSHHEPCLRQGEEYKHLRGKDSVYGDAWNFRTNEKGITRFWEDGLKRSGKFENVITVGMRGEADSAIMGRNATLKDNIDLLRDVLRTQNRLIKEIVNDDLDEVPRMLALYKEVEPYFYGDDKTKGLMDDPQLEGVTLMLCDDNFGNLRTLPTEHMREHKGGYGLYYHFDYHGLPVSFEWVNSSFLPKIWEQMTTAYEFGIRDLWIVNVGDIFTTEFPLAYFLDLAYDFKTWGTKNVKSPKEYTEHFVKSNFGDRTPKEVRKQIARLLTEYTKIAHNRRPEAMNADVYDPAWYDESDELIKKTEELMRLCDEVDEQLDRALRYPFYELVTYPAVANLNIQRMQLLTGKNHLFASQGRTTAMTMAELVEGCLAKDEEIVSHIQRRHEEKWFGMSLSQHIGFRHWCEEECMNPILMSFKPASKKRIVVTVPECDMYTEGGFWSGKVLTLGAFLNPEILEGKFSLTSAGCEPAPFKIECDVDWLRIEPTGGVCNFGEEVEIKVTLCADMSELKLHTKGKNAKVKKRDKLCGLIKVVGENTNALVRVPVTDIVPGDYEAGTFVWCGEDPTDYEGNADSCDGAKDVSKYFLPYEYISMNAEDYVAKKETKYGEFTVLKNFGKTASGIKILPPITESIKRKNAPTVTYRFVVPRDGEYCVDLYMAPYNPAVNKGNLTVGVGTNRGKLSVYKVLPDDYKVENGYKLWEQGALDNIRITTVPISLKKGVNTLDFAALGPQIVLEKLVIYEAGNAPHPSYLGPKRTYCVPKVR